MTWRPFLITLAEDTQPPDDLERQGPFASRICICDGANIHTPALLFPVAKLLSACSISPSLRLSTLYGKVLKYVDYALHLPADIEAPQ